MKTKIYIDGSEGTTGLRIFERMARRDDVELIKIDPELRKDPTARAKCINASDITFLCLPDAAAVEAVSLVSNDNVRIIDASTAHRTAPDWAKIREICKRMELRSVLKELPEPPAAPARPEAAEDDLFSFLASPAPEAPKPEPGMEQGELF